MGDSSVQSALLTMALRLLLILNCLVCSSAACTEGEANCPANYEGEESGLAQIKAHQVKKTSTCPGKMTFNHAELSGEDMPKDGWHKVPADQWKECQQVCADTTGCAGWTLVYGNPDHLDNNINCYLKSKVNHFPETIIPGHSNLISGLMHSVCIGHPSGSHYVDSCGTPDCPDGSQGCATQAHAKDADGCAYAARDMQKPSWTYVKGTDTCWVKDRIFDNFCREFDSTVISGEKACPDSGCP